jgi:hypothetical protein
MANQRMRHKNIESVHTRAINRPDVIEEIGRLSVNPEFIETVNIAVKNPKGSEAKQVNKTFDKLIRVVGANTPYSAAERAAAITQLYALVQMYGLPFVFSLFLWMILTRSWLYECVSRQVLMATNISQHLMKDLLKPCSKGKLNLRKQLIFQIEI